MTRGRELGTTVLTFSKRHAGCHIRRVKCTVELNTRFF